MILNRKARTVPATSKAVARRVAILGPWGSNLGDTAIQEAMLQHIRQYCPDAEIYGFSLIPKETEKRLGIPSFPTGREGGIWWQKGAHESVYVRILMKMRTSSNKHLVAISRWLERAPMEIGLLKRAYDNLSDFDLLIISGGGQLDDYWGGAWSHPYTLLKFSALAKLRGVKVMFVSVGAGPIDQRLSRLFIKLALHIANYRSFRDADSRRFLERLGFKRNDPVYPDLAHSLQIEQFVQASEPLRSGERVLVGIGPMAYFDPRGWPIHDQQVYMGYLSKLAQFTVWLLQEGHRILLFTGEAGFDRDVIVDLRELLAAQGISSSDERIIEQPIETVEDLMAQLAVTKLVVASRFHGVLLAQLLGKPVLALSYHPKIDNLMADMGQADYCLQIDTFDIETLKERFTAMKANCQAIKTHMAGRSQQHREALDDQYRKIFAVR